MKPEPKYYYFFDCLDGVLSDKYWSLEELQTALNRESITEKDIIRTAANYEATLYRYQMDSNGNPINEKILYDCFF